MVLGGEAPGRPGYFYQATVLDDVPADAGILRQEIFGPVAPIVRFADADEAIAMANGTEYGLVSYLYSADLRRALQVAEALEAGHGRHQPRRRVRPGGAVRRGKAVRDRP